MHNQKKIDENVSILGISIFSGVIGEALRKITLNLSNPRSDLLRVFTPNPEQLVLALEDNFYKQLLEKSDLNIPDGVGLVWAGNILGSKIAERISGIDLAEAAVFEALKLGKKVMLVGGRDSAASKAAEKLQVTSYKLQTNSKLQNPKEKLIMGINGAKDIANETETERHAAIQVIKEFSPELLLVAYGAPWQEKWLWENKSELEKLGVKVGMVVGGAIDIWAGNLRRAPKWMRGMGLEWLYRLRQEPWRIRRQAKLIKFVFYVIKFLVHST